MIVGLGIDIIELDRIRFSLERYGKRFIRHVLTGAEWDYCRQFKTPVPEVAARFAAKEAFSKAIGTGITRGVVWRDIEVIKDRGKPPRIRVKGKALEHANRLGVSNIHLSLTHAEKYAAAVVTIENC